MVNRMIGVLLVLAGLVADLMSAVWMMVALLANAERGRRWWRILKAKDQGFNAALGGSEDETLSSRAARARDRGERWGCILCRLLDKIERNHCDEARGQ